MDYSKKGIGYNGYDPGLMAYLYFNPKNLIGIIINTDTDFDDTVKPTLDSIYSTYEKRIN